MKKIIGIICLTAVLTGCSKSDHKGQKEEPKERQQLSQETKTKSEESKSSKNGISKEEAVKLAMKQFEDYLPNILKTYGGVIDLQEPYAGDFTGDGIDDVAIYWSVAPEGGNAIIGQGLSLYKNTGSKMKVIAGYEPDYLFSFDKISNGKIRVKKLEYAEEDGRCCPSISTGHTLTISGNKAY
ncbi:MULTISPECIES: membrane lipoprotein lipid attachment site-containing protein [Chryseobacterium]|uniref:membrane lipoprotein lipid attachment site-containing protein n=1 Tax=Chryseobacterium TaxID=59732 RepID=UPI000D13706B|nr:membrane lipoprotein lipid attachment site-containing protein [Chryseobacterium aurantiacum]